jgi:hypothetical protein
MSLEKKLKRLKISKEDIDILYDGDLSKSELENKYLEIMNVCKEEEVNDDNPTLYYFINRKTGYTITSIHKSLKDAGINYDDYEPIEELKS